MPAQDILDEFPKLRYDPWRETSPETAEYNCFAFAVHDQDDWYSPLPIKGYYWPEDVVPRETTLEAFIQMYAHEGAFVPCETGEPEDGYEKIAIYINSFGSVSHASRLLPTGVWTSKLGNMEDIEHSLLTSLEDAGTTPDSYGQAVQFLKRPSHSHSLIGIRAKLLDLLRMRG
jgi:hypothetical protein